jgi:hypothetical protein
MSENPSDLKVLLLKPQLRVRFAVVDQLQGDSAVPVYGLDPLNSAVLSFLAFIDEALDIAWPVLEVGSVDSSLAGVRRLSRESDIGRRDISPVIVSMQRGSLVINIGWAVIGASVAALGPDLLINLLASALWDLLRWIGEVIIQAISGRQKNQSGLPTDEMDKRVAWLAKEISPSLKKGQELHITIDLQEPGNGLSVAILAVNPDNKVFLPPTFVMGSIVRIDDANERVEIQLEGDRSDIVLRERQHLPIKDPQRFAPEEGRAPTRLAFLVRSGIRCDDDGPSLERQVCGALCPTSGSTGLNEVEEKFVKWFYQVESALVRRHQAHQIYGGVVLVQGTVNYLMLRPHSFGRRFTRQQAIEFIDSLVNRGILTKDHRDKLQYLRLNWGLDYGESGAEKTPQVSPFPPSPTTPQPPPPTGPKKKTEMQQVKAVSRPLDEIINVSV